jgi:HK97 family phage major capsid protein
MKLKISNGMKWRLLLMVLLMGICAFPVEAQQFVNTLGVNLDLAALIGGGAVLGMALPTMDEEEFREKVLGGVEGVSEDVAAFGTKVKSIERQLTDPDNAPPVIKKAMEDITRLKKTANDQQANMEQFQRAITKFKEAVGNEKRLALGDPIKRITEDSRLNTMVNAIARKMVRAPLSGAHADALKEITKALGEDTSPGSTIVDDELSKELYSSLAMNGAWNKLAVRPMGAKQTKFAVKTARPVAVVLLTEADTIPDDANKAGASVTAEAELIAVLLNVSIQLLEDTEIDLTSDLMEDFMEALNLRLDYLAYRSDGTADQTNGGMTGLFNFGTAAVAAAGNTTVENLDLDDFLRCLTTVDSAVLTRKSKFFLHPHILARSLAIRDANGRPIFLTGLEAPAFGALGSYLGYPAELVDQAPNTNAANSKVLAFGDPNAYAVGIRRVFAFESSDHHKWNNFQRSFRGTGRAGCKGRKASALAVLTTAAA